MSFSNLLTILQYQSAQNKINVAMKLSLLFCNVTLKPAPIITFFKCEEKKKYCPIQLHFYLFRNLLNVPSLWLNTNFNSNKKKTIQANLAKEKNVWDFSENISFNRHYFIFYNTLPIKKDSGALKICYDVVWKRHRRTQCCQRHCIHYG